MTLSLSNACLSLKGVGPALAQCLMKLGIHSLADILFHLPLRYQDRTIQSPINTLMAGDVAVVTGVVTRVEVLRGKRTILAVHIEDDSGFSLALKFFHFNAGLEKTFALGSFWRCFGEVKGSGRFLEMIHPEYRRQTTAVLEQEGPAHLTPIYPSTAGVSQHQWLAITEQVLRLITTDGVLPELLPASLCQALGFPRLEQALQWIHRPPVGIALDTLMAGTHPAQQRLAFEELLAHQLSLKCLRASAQQHPAVRFTDTTTLPQQLLSTLPFALTGAQRRVSQEIWADLAKPYPMLRLVQGDVGSGKTIIAALSTLPVLAGGFQVALMAPTELLAEQHWHNFQQWLSPLGFRVESLLGKHTAKTQRQVTEQLALGTIDVVIGTHALFQEKVLFSRLGLVIIDEQHRFGVHQRLSLHNKGVNAEHHPHQLIMTATPIPRTLAMTAYADLDHSIIDELPPGRMPVTTLVLNNTRRSEVLAKVTALVERQQQIYWVCPLIEESEVLQCQAAEVTWTTLQTALPQVRCALVHGRMKGADKTAIMKAFKAGEYDILVATTVIEVGVDVPNASLMVIENAERLGLAQLHQLRGRVGRGASQSFCVLLYQMPLSHLAKARLSAMKETSDGFIIAQRDLAIRGPGEVLGTRQTGLLTWRIADLERDQALLPEVERVATQWLAQQSLGQQSALIQPLLARWLGEEVHYGQV